MNSLCIAEEEIFCQRRWKRDWHKRKYIVASAESKGDMALFRQSNRWVKAEKP
jgi:hypothetical protein